MVTHGVGERPAAYMMTNRPIREIEPLMEHHYYTNELEGRELVRLRHELIRPFSPENLARGAFADLASGSKAALAYSLVRSNRIDAKQIFSVDLLPGKTRFPFLRRPLWDTRLPSGMFTTVFSNFGPLSYTETPKRDAHRIWREISRITAREGNVIVGPVRAPAMVGPEVERLTRGRLKYRDAIGVRGMAVYYVHFVKTTGPALTPESAVRKLAQAHRQVAWNRRLNRAAAVWSRIEGRVRVALNGAGGAGLVAGILRNPVATAVGFGVYGAAGRGIGWAAARRGVWGLAGRGAKKLVPIVGTASLLADVGLAFYEVEDLYFGDGKWEDRVAFWHEYGGVTRGLERLSNGKFKEWVLNQ